MSASNVTIRRARADDLALLPMIEAAADELFTACGIGPLPPPSDVEALAASLLVLVAGDPPIGFARLEQVDGQAHLEQLAVDPRHARQGVGSRLLQAAVMAAQQEGYERLTLITFRDVAWNGPYYARHGFEPVEHLTAGLSRLRDHEQQLGLDDLGARVVLTIDTAAVAVARRPAGNDASNPRGARQVDRE
jgi:GNAT superfamily N-acetyltransferase